MANSDEYWRIVFNHSKWGTQNLRVNLAATWNGIFPQKGMDAYQDKRCF